MKSVQNILASALNHPAMQEDLELVQHRSQTIPGSVHYIINRYKKASTVILHDMGMMVYNYNEEIKEDSSLELVFCISGNRYCKENEQECTFCKHSLSHECGEMVSTIDVACFKCKRPENYFLFRRYFKI